MNTEKPSSMLVIGVAAIIVALAIAYYFVIFLPQTYKEPQVQSVSQSPPKTQALSGEQLLAAEQECSKSAYQTYLQQAREIGGLFGKEVGLGMTYSNHFNPQLAKCFVKLSYSYTNQGGKIVPVEVIYDVYDNQVLVSCNLSNNQCSNANFVIPQKEYNDLVSQYFETSQQTVQ